MPASRTPPRGSSEHLLAELTDAAYRVALRHGLRGPFLDVELDLWTALRAVLAKELAVTDRPDLAPDVRVPAASENPSEAVEETYQRWFVVEEHACPA
jgi:hypothetical protein